MPSGIYIRTKPGGMLGKKQKEETKKIISEIFKNKYKKGYLGTKGLHWKLSEKTKNKISKSRLEKKDKSGYINSEETRKKMRKAKLGRRKEMANNWQGGLSVKLYPYEWTEYLKDSIRKRDNYTCQECGIHQDELSGRLKNLDIHHIDYNKQNLTPDNLITLCRICHCKTNGDRNYWINYFKSYVP